MMTTNSIQKLSRQLPTILLVCLCISLTACTGGITRVEIDPATHMTCDSTFNTPCGVLDKQPVTIRVWGHGKCDSVGVSMGDGTTLYSPWQYDFGTQGTGVPFEVTQTYNNPWPGLKTIHAFPNANCMGEASTTIQVMRKIGNDVRSDLNFTLAQPYSFANGITPGPCKLAFDEHNVRGLRPNTRVTVTATPGPNNKIDFGCFLGGCIYGVDGETGSSAAAPFPFAEKAKFSLILKVGSQIEQGGSHTTFTTTSGGALELCVNDDALRDNRGAWNFTVAVDESQAR